MSREFDIYIEEAKKIEEIYGNLDNILRELKVLIKKYLSDSKIYLFGSVVRGKYTMSSDIDILVITEQKERVDLDRLKALIKKKFIDIPFQLHIVSNKEYEKWYKKFIPNTELKEI